jgi:hypothetical protein
MKRLFIVLFVVLNLAPATMGHAQEDRTSAFIAITFDEVSAGNPCLLAVNTYAGLFGGDVANENLPIVTENSDCSLPQGSSLRIRMGRAADSYLIFNSGALDIELFLTGERVLSESTNGADSMNSEAVFDEIRFTATEESVISDISLSFAFNRLASDSFTFERAPEGSPCLETLAWAYLDSFIGPAIITPTTDTGLGAPECSVPPNETLTFFLNVPASLVEFASSGTAEINLLLDGHPVQPPALVSGAGGYFATSIVGFNEVQITALDTGVRLDNLALDYPAFADAGCTLNPGNELTLAFERPVVTFGFWSGGGGIVEAYRGGELVRPADDVNWQQGYYFISDNAGLDTIIIKEDTGFSSIIVSDIRLSVLPPTGLQVVNFFEAAAGTACTDVLAAAGLTATANVPPEWEVPSIQPTDEETAFGFEQRCQFDPGSSLTITLDRLAFGLNFFMAGGATVQFLRDGQAVTEPIDVSGLPFTYSDQIWTGFDQVVFTEPSGFASFGLVGLEILYGE